MGKYYKAHPSTVRSLNLYKKVEGKRFGTVVVVAKVGNSDRDGGVLIRCDCGREKVMRRSRLKKIKTCGAGLHRSTSGPLPGPYWANLKTNAKDRGLKVEVTPEDAWALFEKQRGKCALTGRKIEIASKNMTASIDRVYSDGDYTLDNIQWVHKDLNKMKMEFEQEYFIETCREVARKAWGGLGPMDEDRSDVD